jgi:hypothetical protein
MSTFMTAQIENQRGWLARHYRVIRRTDDMVTVDLDAGVYMPYTTRRFRITNEGELMVTVENAAVTPVDTDVLPETQEGAVEAEIEAVAVEVEDAAVSKAMNDLTIVRQRRDKWKAKAEAAEAEVLRLRQQVTRLLEDKLRLAAEVERLQSVEKRLMTIRKEVHFSLAVVPGESSDQALRDALWMIDQLSIDIRVGNPIRMEHPQTITYEPDHVTDAGEMVTPVEPGSYKNARGVLAPADEPAEVSIRRLRDGVTTADNPPPTTANDANEGA